MGGFGFVQMYTRSMGVLLRIICLGFLGEIMYFLYFKFDYFGYEKGDSEHKSGLIEMNDLEDAKEKIEELKKKYPDGVISLIEGKEIEWEDL